jgi:hypothetical protein
MKIAEALLLKADMDTKITSLTDRIKKYAVVQEDTVPDEDPTKLIKKVSGVIADRFELILRIQAANARVKTADGRVLSDVLTHRDMLRWQAHIIKQAVDATQKEQDRYRPTELKWVSVIDVEKMQKQLDGFAKRLREVNAAIQEANWREDLE